MSKPDDILWLRQLRDLERYCNKKGFRVVYKSVDIDTVYCDRKLIVMSNKLKDEISMYHLLHELGHFRVMQKKKTYTDSYTYIFENFSNASLTHRIAIIQEELDAWREGLKVARSLDLYIDRRKWEITKTRCISTYLSWALRNKRKKIEKKDSDENRTGNSKNKTKK